MRPRVLIVGHVTHDRLGSGLVPGGSVYYAGEVYRRLGADVRICAAVGTDFQFHDWLARTPHRVATRGQTTVFTNLYPPGHARIQLVEAVAGPVIPDILPDELCSADIVHLMPVMGEVDIVAWRRAVDTRLLAINVQGWLREAGPEVDREAVRAQLGDDVASWVRGRHVVQKRWDISKEALQGVDVACLSEEDLDGQGDLLDRLCEAIPLVAFTRGSQGSEIIESGMSGRAREPGQPERSSKRTHVGVYRTGEVDLTGAGDTFAAGFLYQLALGKPVIEAARFGAAAASIVIEGVGAIALEHLDQAYERAAMVSE
jgi:sugar/nucleoside kinase (ribokinase family)